MAYQFNFSYQTNAKLHQKGAALILMAFILGLGMAAYLLMAYNSDAEKVKRDEKTYLALKEVKIALIGYSRGAIGTGQRPGDMILPDSASEPTANYDGSADGGCLDASKINGLPLVNNGNVNMRCLGRLPWKSLGMAISNFSENDTGGKMPWYAVSANLVDPACLKVLNSDTLNLVNNPSPAALDCTGTTLPYPWLTVRDGSGNIVSNRVAAIIFMPNAVSGSQSRPSAPLGMANQYLDTLVVPVGCNSPCVPGIYSNADMDNDYIFSSEGSSSAAASNFTDQLVYITIDELMESIEKRVAGEARRQLLAYKVTNGIFPYAASLGYQGQSCVQGLNSGFLPLPIFSCTGSKCDGAFPATVKFTSDVNYLSSSGACTALANVCSCTGLGGCSKVTAPRRIFGCSITGTCVSNITGTFNYLPSPPVDNSSLSVTGGACTVVGTTATCTGAGNVAVDGSVNQCALPVISINNFPLWFLENGWKHYIYYEKSPTSSLQVGGKTGISSLLIATGGAVTNAPFTFKGSTQARPSAFISDYLDSAENTDTATDLISDGHPVFEATNKHTNLNYNDQIFIVSP